MEPRLRLPPYVQAFRDRHGRARYYFRRPGFDRVALPGLPWSPEFMATHSAALGGEKPAPAIGESRTHPGTVNAALVAYYASGAFRELAPKTRENRRSILERFRSARGQAGDTLSHGEKPLALLKPEHVNRLMAAMPAPTAISFCKTLRGFCQYCVKVGLIAVDPTASVKRPRYKTAGFHTWTEEEIARFEATHAIGTKARLAFALLLFTAQRRGDVIRMGRQHVRAGVLHVVQSKTGAALDIPIHPQLATIIAATPSDQLTFITSQLGTPYSPGAFTALMREWCDEAGGLSECSSHGLRKAACRRLAEAGATAPQIMAISGHRTMTEAQIYIKAADQALMARDAMRLMTPARPKKRTRIVKPASAV
jgi:integrase